MSRIVFGESDRVAAWVTERTGADFFPGQCQGFGVEDETGNLIAGVIYDSYNGASMQVHVAAKPDCNWLSREFLRVIFAYPFRQLRVNKLIGLVDATNKVACDFDEHVGFRLEATLKDACPGGDLLIYTMTPDQCRWINVSKEVRNGKEKGSAAA